MLPQRYEFQGPSYREGYERGYKEGCMEGHLLAVLAVLDVRGLHVSAAFRERVQACVDPDALVRCLRRAVVVNSAEELFDE